MKLPNGDHAVIPMKKLIGYCLNPNHSSGKHKARVFASTLGITTKNANDLRELIAIAAIEGEVIQQDGGELRFLRIHPVLGSVEMSSNPSIKASIDASRLSTVSN